MLVFTWAGLIHVFPSESFQVQFKFLEYIDIEDNELTVLKKL